MRIKLNGSRNLLSKAIFSATVGLPLNLGLNFVLLIYLIDILKIDIGITAMIVTAIFFFVSVSRMFLIDVYHQKHKVKFDLIYYIKRIVK